MLRNQFDQLEIKGLWADAVDLAFGKRIFTEAMCRCIFYGWYLPLESPCIQPGVVQPTVDAAHDNLVKVFNEAVKSTDSVVLREVGYGMSIAPWLFPGDPGSNEIASSKILRMALDLDKINPITIELHNGSRSSGPSCLNPVAVSAWHAYVQGVFPSEGEYDRYYRSILISEGRPMRPVKIFKRILSFLRRN